MCDACDRMWLDRHGVVEVPAAVWYAEQADVQQLNAERENELKRESRKALRFSAFSPFELTVRIIMLHTARIKRRIWRR